MTPLLVEEAAMTTASHIRLPKSIRGEAENQKALEKVVDNYEKKYVELMAAQSCNTDDIKTDEFREVLDDVVTINVFQRKFKTIINDHMNVVDV